MLNDRIENRRIERNLKFFKWAAVISLLIAVFKILLTPEILNDGGRMVDYITTLIPIGLFLQYRSTAKKWGGQFIEWNENEISFKSRKCDNTTIKLVDIKSIDILLDIISIITLDKKYEINIEDFTNYKDRVRIKGNFEKVKLKLSTQNI